MSTLDIQKKKVSRHFCKRQAIEHIIYIQRERIYQATNSFRVVFITITILVLNIQICMKPLCFISCIVMFISLQHIVKIYVYYIKLVHKTFVCLVILGFKLKYKILNRYVLVSAFNVLLAMKQTYFLMYLCLG